MDESAGEAMPGLETLALRLAELRGAVDVGNERTAGQLQLLVQRSDQAQQALAQQREWFEKEVARIERDIELEQTARAEADKLEQTARAEADRVLAGDLKLLERKSATWTGVGLTLSALGGTLLGHYWPH